MPILLDNLDQNANVKQYTPKYFSNSLTGKGKNTGVINETRNPAHPIELSRSKIHHIVSDDNNKLTNNNTKTERLVTNPIMPSIMDAISMKLPDTAVLVSDDMQSEIYVNMELIGLDYEDKEENKIHTRNVYPTYMLQVFTKHKNTNNDLYEPEKTLALQPTKNSVITYSTANPMVQIESIKTHIQERCDMINDPPALKAYAPCKVYMDKLNDYMTDYSLYDELVRQVMQWNEEMGTIVPHVIEQLKAQHTSEKIERYIAYIEKYNIPLDVYKSIYDSICKLYANDTQGLKTICKQNLNLLLNNTLFKLNSNKASLIKPMQTKQVDMTKFNNYSNEQIKAITTDEPLTLVQAGAGTGKSTVILGRIKYMVEAGIKPSDITVLSFTNAAANHIKALNPQVHSMTIASMVHSIYALNFPQHTLSNIDTLANSVDIYCPNMPNAKAFKNLLYAVKRNEHGSFTAMNSFIEDNYDSVIDILNTTHQTSLELEIIICYQQIDNLKEPADVQSKYLIIDEVQDNSIFEFIYTLKYTDKHKESLFIVGDCSQTLYEFRASNPRALNVLEGSGVFNTYQLNTNYRSNQEILAFANVLLGTIEANQYANIQLRSNTIKPVTKQSFDDAVKVSYQRVSRITDFDKNLDTIMATVSFDYIKDKLAKGEKVACLAYTRKQVSSMERACKKMFPDKRVISIIPDRINNTTIFSNFVKKYWKEVKFVQSKNIMSVISQLIVDKLEYLVPNKDKVLPIVQKQVAQWYNEESNRIKAFTVRYLKNNISLDEFLEIVKENMLQFEIKYNAVKQALISSRNEEQKKAQDIDNADIVLSTIHSAKGLEFENVILLYHNDNVLAEDKKRMYYVALTRAMKSELIIAYDTVTYPTVINNYETVMKSLK